MLFDHFVDERDDKLLLQDRFTFSVLRRILTFPCTLILSDHEKMILCISSPDYPTWIWTPDEIEKEEQEKIWQVLKNEGLLKKDARFNVKYEFADYLKKKALEEGMEMGVKTNEFAYECPEAILPHKVAEGSVYQCQPSDIDLIAWMLKNFHEELNLDQRSDEVYRQNAKQFVEEQCFFFWKDPQGKVTAGCRYVQTKDNYSISNVYTMSASRRKAYAENLVYHVTGMGLAKGFKPTLYTDADNPASNRCYEKIGYQRRGALCSLQVKKA